MDSLASVLDVLRWCVLHHSRAEHGDKDSVAPGGEFAGFDVLSFRVAHGRARLDKKSARPISVDTDAAGASLQRRRSLAGS